MAKERVKVSMDYNLKSHIVGKIWMFFALAIFFAVPTTICLYYDVKPDMTVMGSSAVLIPFIINFLSGVFEPIVYSPMLGTNSAYLAFITGNLSNLKIPCVVKAQEICGTKLGTEENEVVSTLSVATSTLVTTVIIAVFVLILALSNVETAIRNTPWIIPAFTCVVYALFGSLGGKYVVKNIKLAVFPLTIIVVLSIVLGVLNVNPGSAYLFVGIALCALFAVLQIVREKKKQKAAEETEHLAEIANSEVEIINDENGNTPQDEELTDITAQDNTAQDNTAQDDTVQEDSAQDDSVSEEVEETVEQIAQDTQSVD